MIFELHFDLATRGKALALKFDFAEDSQFSMQPTWFFSWTWPFDPDCGWSLNLDRIFTKSSTKTSKNTGASWKKISDAICNQRRFEGLTDCKQWLRRLTGTNSHACSRIDVKTKHNKSVSEAGKSFYDSLRLDGLDDELHARILQDLFNTLQHVADGVVTICLSVRLSACGSHISTFGSCYLPRCLTCQTWTSAPTFPRMIQVFIKQSNSCSFFCNPGTTALVSACLLTYNTWALPLASDSNNIVLHNASVLLQSSNRVSCG